MHFSLILHSKTKADAIVPVFFMYIRINFIHRKIRTKQKMKMKKFYTMLLLAAATCGTASAQYQLPNSDFEGGWESVAYSGKTGDEPKNWSSFLDGTGNLKNMAGYNQLEKSTDKPAGSKGSYSVKLTSRAVKMGIITLAVAQGNITTGCINMGSTNAKDANGNYNYINSARDDQNPTFTGHPDAVKFWVKFKGSKTANASIYLVTDGYFQDPEVDKNEATKVAHAKNGDIASNDTWTEITVPFTYYADEAPTHVLASFSTCATPGDGKDSDYMYLDDIMMVYNSELETAKYNDAVVTFTNGAATVDAEYDENLLSLTSNGRAATIEKSYDAATGLLTITVKGDNISEDATNKHVYTIQFATPKASATMSVSAAAGWGTFCAPFAVTAPSGVTVSTILSIGDNGQLTLLRVGGAIPANTPVLLKSSSNVSTTFEGDAVDGTPSKSYLTGVYTPTAAPEGSYVLQNQNSGIGFYLVEPGTAVTVQPNRCYLTLPAGSNCRALFFDESDFVTALDNAIIVDEPEAAYDLQGRRVYPEHQSKGVNVAGQKGMLIIGGRKVIK